MNRPNSDHARFAKVCALHDDTAHSGEKAAAAAKMASIAAAGGMTVAQAVSKLDAMSTKPRNPFEELFNSPEMRASRAEYEAKRAKRRAEWLEEYGSEDAVWELCEREILLKEACRPVITRKPIMNGKMDTLMGWDGGRYDQMPFEVREAISGAYPLPSTVCEAWAEYGYWEKRGDDQSAFDNRVDHFVWVRGRITILEHLLDTMPGLTADDVRARMDWMESLLNRGFDRDVLEDLACLSSLRASFEAVQNGRRTNADKRREVLALLDTGLSDREIARRVGVSPQTVGNIRRG